VGGAAGGEVKSNIQHPKSKEATRFKFQALGERPGAFCLYDKGSDEVTDKVLKLMRGKTEGKRWKGYGSGK
jgi:hypothetical protein